MDPKKHLLVISQLLRDPSKFHFEPNGADLCNLLMVELRSTFSGAKVNSNEGTRIISSKGVVVKDVSYGDSDVIFDRFIIKVRLLPSILKYQYRSNYPVFALSLLAQTSPAVLPPFDIITLPSNPPKTLPPSRETLLSRTPLLFRTPPPSRTPSSDIILSSPVITPSLHNESGGLMIKPTSSTDLFKKCFLNGIEDMGGLGMDYFTNEVLIGYFIEYIYENFGGYDQGLDGFIKYLDVAICPSLENKYGTIMEDRSQIGSIDRLLLVKEVTDLFETKEIVLTSGKLERFVLPVLKKSILLSIFTQIIVNLDFLQEKLHFNHGYLTIEHVLLFRAGNKKDSKLGSESIGKTINYKGIARTNTFITKITSFSQAGITISYLDETNNNLQYLRLYNYNPIFIPIRNVVISTYNDIHYYILEPDITISRYREIRSAGLPFFLSFDTYIFVLSYMLIPFVFYQVFTDQDSKKSNLRELIWDPLWFDEFDNNNVFLNLQDALEGKKPNNIETILKIIRQSKLRCDLTSHYIELLRKLS